MKILIVGLGVIGSTYGYLFQAAGHRTEHLVRPEKRNAIPSRLEVKLLDGRGGGTGEHKEASYAVCTAEIGGCYDYILVSVAAGKLEAVLQSLKDAQISGTLLLFCGVWEERRALQTLLEDWHYILGYPVAGGKLEDGVLDCVVFDHVMLEGEEKAAISGYAELVGLLRDASLKVEVPYDMLEWIWLHMAVNAGVIATAGKYGGVEDTAASAEKLMESSDCLSEAVRAVRETARIISARGVDLRKYRNELLPYRLPSELAGVVMKRMFKSSELTRRIMTLHNNRDDLLYVCKNVYQCGKAHDVSAPVFNLNYERIRDQLFKPSRP